MQAWCLLLADVIKPFGEIPRAKVFLFPRGLLTTLTARVSWF